MTATVLKFPVRKPRRETRRTVAQRLVPQIIGALFTQGEVTANPALRICGRDGVTIEGMTHPELPLFVTVRQDGQQVFRFGLSHFPSEDPRNLFDGRVYVTAQRRGEWEAIVERMNAPDIMPAECLTHWLRRADA